MAGDELSRSEGRTLRSGDSGVGIPRSAGTEGARRVSAEETETYQRQQEDDERQRLLDHLQDLEAMRPYELPRFVRRLALWGGVALAAVVGLVLVTQVATLMASVETMVGPARWVLSTLGAVCGAVILWLTLRLAWALVRLRKSPEVNGAALEHLRERQVWQKLAVEHLDQAESKLKDYLMGYAINPGREQPLLAAGLTEEDVSELADARRHLLEDAFLPSDEWLVEYQRRFQDVLDSAARRRARHYGQRAALGTALVPIAAVDQALILYCCLRLVRDLLVIYGVRPAFGQTITILVRAIVQTYLGGEMQSLTEEGAEAALDAVAGSAEELVESAATAMASQVGAKLVEGGVNGLLVWRLGTRTISFLQPVSGSVQS